jgi:hypothetical protein
VSVHLTVKWVQANGFINITVNNSTMYQAFENLARDLIITAGAAYAAIMVGGGIVECIFSEKIRSQEHLNRILDEETSKLGMGEDVVIGKFYRKGERGHRIFGSSFAAVCGYDKMSDECLLPYDQVDGVNVVPVKLAIIKEGRLGGTERDVRHEIYHLYKHMPTPTGLVTRTLKYMLHDEPTAIIYALTGLKF